MTETANNIVRLVATIIAVLLWGASIGLWITGQHETAFFLLGLAIAVFLFLIHVNTITRS